MGPQILETEKHKGIQLPFAVVELKLVLVKVELENLYGNESRIGHVIFN